MWHLSFIKLRPAASVRAANDCSFHTLHCQFYKSFGRSIKRLKCNWMLALFWAPLVELFLLFDCFFSIESMKCIEGSVMIVSCEHGNIHSRHNIQYHKSIALLSHSASKLLPPRCPFSDCVLQWLAVPLHKSRRLWGSCFEYTHR